VAAHRNLAAGRALDSAGIKNDKEILARTDMIVAAGGGECDLDVDAAILTARADARSGALNERLMNDLRPTLFLAQLSNLLAGNISIVHGVSGSSRTFMGEETAGVDAAQIAWAKIASGQSEVALVGAAHNGERKEMLMLYECGGFNLKKDFASVWSRNGGGFALASGGVFLVLESRLHAERRGAKPFAHGSSTSSPVIPPDLPRAESKAFWEVSGRPWGSPRMQPRSTRQRQALRLPPRKRQPSCRHTGMSQSARSAHPSDISAKRNSR
jgi:3-oxoacyl-[acyl-carrier-protein] synthase II